MKKEVAVLSSMLTILAVVTFFSVRAVLKVNEAKRQQVEVVEKQVEHSVEYVKEEKKSSNQEKDTKNHLFEEEQVVTDHIYPVMDLASRQPREDKLPKGTVVSVKPVKGHDEWVEIDSNPAKGFIEKKYLEKRDKHITLREQKRQKKLPPHKFKQEVDLAINDFVAKNGGDISVYLQTANEDFSYSYEGDKVRRTASSIKLPFIAYLMTLADKGQVNLNEKLTYTANFKVDGTGIIQFEPIGTQYTIKHLSELVIRYSDNVAYLMLLNYIGEPNFVKFLSQLDANSPNNRVFSTPRILTKSMEYVCKNKDSSQNIQMLFDWLQDSTFDDGVAVGLPGVDVAHKTGWMPMYAVSNDIAFVKDKKRPYYITIMTGGYDSSYSEQSISDLSAIIDEHVLQLDL